MMKPVHPNVYPPMQRACAPENCRCDCCRNPSCAPKNNRSYLLPRILACGREWLRNDQNCLQVEGLPACAEPPFKLVSVDAVGEPSWVQQADPARRVLRLHVTIPLVCQVEDKHGCMYCGRSCVEVDTVLQLPVHPAECWRNCLMFLPCVRLACAPSASQELCFSTQLEIYLESYMVRWEPCMSIQPKPECPPPLPLYPQPCVK